MKLQNLLAPFKFFFPTIDAVLATKKIYSRTIENVSIEQTDFILKQIQAISEREESRRRQLDDKAKSILQGNLTIAVLGMIPLQLPSQNIGALPSAVFILGFLYLLSSIIASFQALKPTQVHMLTLEELKDLRVTADNLAQNIYTNVKRNELCIIIKSNFIDSSIMDTIFSIILIIFASITHVFNIGTPPFVIELRTNEFTHWAIHIIHSLYSI